MFSDQQCVTGLAIIISAYYQLQFGLLRNDWQIIIYLTLFSSLTHIATITFLRDYMDENLTIRCWRILLMLSLAVSLSVALLPSGTYFWDIYTGPAWCAFRSLRIDLQRSSATFVSMLLSEWILIMGYLTRIIRMWKLTSEWSLWLLRSLPGNILKYIMRCISSWQTRNHQSYILNFILRFLHRLVVTIYVMGKIAYDLGASSFLEVSSYSDR